MPLFFCFVSFFIILFFGRKIGTIGTHTIVTFCTMMSFFSVLFIFYYAFFKVGTFYLVLNDWINVGLFDSSWSFVVDNVTSSMFMLVSFVSMCTIYYSVDYMYEDPHQNRFLAYLSLFTLFMYILITTDNLVQLFIGWEGVGICSYLLINFWYTRLRANKSSLLALFLNKIGDLFFILFFSLVFFTYKTINFFVLKNIFLLFFEINIFYGLSEFFVLCAIIAAVAKSSQIGLHFWLPEAMEGPTPVSSLIHAATMVTAGIYLLVRLSFFYVSSPSLSCLIIILGGLTAFMGSTIGVFQYDIKKVVAYSTCSQLGYMFFSLIYMGGTLSLYHLVTHGFFKALLFLTSGYIIHSILGEQDVRMMGGLIKLMPFSYILLFISSFSLCGLPFLSGFYSKESIINYFYYYNIHYSLFNVYFFFELLVVVAAFFTIIYSVKTIFYVYFGTYRGSYGVIINMHASSPNTLVPLFALCLFSMAGGYLSSEIFLGSGINLWYDSIFYANYYIISNSPFLHSFILFFLVYLVIFNLFFFINDNTFFFPFYSSWFFYTSIILSYKYAIFNINSFIPYLSRIVLFFFKYDKVFLENIAPYGSYKASTRLSYKNLFLETGYIYHYIGLLLLTILMAAQIYFYVQQV